MKLEQLTDDECDRLAKLFLERPSRVGRMVQALPGAAAAVTQVVVDNPGQFAMIAAGTVVITRTAFRIMQPRTALEALALLAVLQIGLPQLAMTAMEKGWIKFNVRTPDGRLVPLTGSAKGDVAVPTPA